MEWHLRDTAAIAGELKADLISGLSSIEAAERLTRFGANELQDREGGSPWRILWEQFASTMSLILIAAALLSTVVGSYRDSLAIMAIVCLFALLGFAQEYRVERAIRALRRLAAPNVRVRRDGAVIEIPSSYLVPRDLTLLEAGNLAPADCRVVESHNLMVQEAVLTGEAEAVEKSGDTLLDRELPLGDRRNMVFGGTTISYGREIALVVATGMETELGRIASMLRTVGRDWTPLQRRLDHLGKILAGAATLIALLFFRAGALRGEDPRFVGLIAMHDPPRKEARDSVDRCRRAGIRPVMITGDHPLTAKAIASSLGICGAEGRVVTGVDLDHAGQDGAAAMIGDTLVFARVSPAHKLLIVETHKNSGEVVAMTGDGVNDASALKKADIGVSMGITGTDVAKEASDMVVSDDNFATIVSAVEEGRTIYDNIRKFFVFSVAGNLGKILAVTACFLVIRGLTYVDIVGIA